MSIHLSDTNLLLAAGDFLTIYLFGYMHRAFCKKRDWLQKKEILVCLIYVLDWVMLFTANMMEIPPLNLISMITAYMLPLFLIYHVKGLRALTNFLFYMVGVMVMEIVWGISAGYLNNKMGFHTRYELLTPQVALIMNFTEIILVLLICRFGSKEKDKKPDRMIFLLMAIPLSRWC